MGFHPSMKQPTDLPPHNGVISTEHTFPNSPNRFLRHDPLSAGNRNLSWDWRWTRITEIMKITEYTTIEKRLQPPTCNRMVKCFMFWKSQSTHKTFAVSLKPWHLCFWLCHCKTLCAISFLKIMLYPDAKCHPQWGPLYKNVHNYMPQSLPKGFECPFWEQTWTDSQGSVLQVWNSNLTAQKTEDHSYCIWKDVLSAHTHNVLYTTDLSFERTMSSFLQSTLIQQILHHCMKENLNACPWTTFSFLLKTLFLLKQQGLVYIRTILEIDTHFEHDCHLQKFHGK